MRFHNSLFEKKDHIINKMPKLAGSEKVQLIDFFKKKVNLETKIDWNKWKTLTFDDFSEVMKDTASAKKKRAKVLRHQGISGLKEGEDYIHVKTKNKSFLVYIPLHYKANQVIFSSHIGDCTHQGCIGSSNAKQYYRSEAQQQGKVPVVVIGNETKYTVMINRDNKKWDLWYADNQAKDMTHGEGIPNFSIKKELITSSTKKMYDDIRIKIWDADSLVDEEVYDTAVEAYESLASDLERYISDIDYAQEQQEDDVRLVIDNTIEEHEKWAKEAEEEAKEEHKADPNFIPDNLMAKRKEIESIMKAEPKGTGKDAFGNTVWNLRDVDYTKQELDKIMKVTAQDAAKKYLVSKDTKPIDFSERDEHLEVARKLKELVADGEWYQVYRHNRDNSNKWLDDVSWNGDIPYNEYEYEKHVHYPNVYSYSDYFDFAYEHMGTEGSGEELLMDINEFRNTGQSFDGQEFLADNDFPHPDTGEFNF